MFIEPNAIRSRPPLEGFYKTPGSINALLTEGRSSSHYVCYTKCSRFGFQRFVFIPYRSLRIHAGALAMLNTKRRCPFSPGGTSAFSMLGSIRRVAATRTEPFTSF